MNLASPTVVNRIIGMMPDAVAITYGGTSGYGHEGLPPGMAFEDSGFSVGQPSVVVAAGYFPGLAVDRTDGIEGVTGSSITVGDFTWRISRVLKASEDGAELLLMLTDPS